MYNKRQILKWLDIFHEIFIIFSTQLKKLVYAYNFVKKKVIESLYKIMLNIVVGKE